MLYNHLSVNGKDEDEDVSGAELAFAFALWLNMGVYGIARRCREVRAEFGSFCRDSFKGRTPRSMAVEEIKEHKNIQKE